MTAVEAGDIAGQVSNLDAGQPSECAPGIDSSSPEGPPIPQSDPHRANPIHVGSGNKYHSETIFKTNTEFPINYAIHYNSRYILPDAATGRWTTSYSQHIYSNSTLNPGSTLSKMELFRPDGQVISFPVGTLNHVPGPVPIASVGFEKRVLANGTIEVPGSAINAFIQEGDLVALSNTRLRGLVNGSWRDIDLPNLLPYRVLSVSGDHIRIQPANGSGWPAFSEAYTKADLQIRPGSVAGGVSSVANYEAVGEVRYTVSSLTIDPAALGWSGGNGPFTRVAYTQFEYVTPSGYIEKYDYRGLLTSIKSPENLEHKLVRTISKYVRGFEPYTGDYVCSEIKSGQCTAYSNINYLNWTCKAWENLYLNTPQLGQKCRLYGHITAQCNSWQNYANLPSVCMGYEDIKEGHQTTDYSYSVVLSDDFGNQISWSESGRRREGHGSVCDGCTDSLTTPVGTYTFQRNGGLIKKVTRPDATNNGSREFLYGISNASYQGGCSVFWKCTTALTGIIDEEGVRYASWDYLNYTQSANNSDVHMARAYKSYHGTGSEVEDLYEIQYTDGHNRKVTNDQGHAQTLYFTAGDGFIRLDSVSGTGGTNCKNTAMSYSYNAKRQVSKITYDSKFTYDYTYYPDGRVETITEAKGTDFERKALYVWNSNINRRLRSVLLYEKTKEIQLVEFFYWSNGRLKQRAITDRTNITTPYSTYGRKLVTDYTHEYHSGSGVKVKTITIDGPRNDVVDTTKFSFNTTGQLESVINAAGHNITYENYDSTGMPRRVIDENGVASIIAFNLRGQLTQLNLGGLSTYDLKYYKNGLLKTILYPAGESITFEYTSARRLKTAYDNLGNRIEISRSIDVSDSSLRNVITLIKNHLGQERFAEKVQLDALGRAYKWFGEKGNVYVDQFGYDAQGNLTNYVNGGVYSSSASIDRLGRVDTVTASDNGITTIKYNALDRITSVKDPRNLSTIYTVDGFGRVIQQSSPDTGTSIFHYDSAGNTTKIIDNSGRQITYTYDGLNRLTDITYPGSQGHGTYYRYDAVANSNYGKGRLTSSGVANGRGSYSFKYNKKGELIEKTVNVAGRSYRWSYQYDGSGNLISMRYPSGRALTYLRSSIGRITKITSNYAGIDEVVARDMVYEPFGPLKSFYFGNGVKHETAYNKAYWPDTMTDTTIRDDKLHYWNSGLMRLNDSRISGIEDVNYNYDSGARLNLVETANLRSEYEYDLTGNRDKKTSIVGGASVVMDTVVQSQSNRIQNVVGQANWEYNSNGQLSRKPASNEIYLYGDNSRLKTYQKSSGSTEYEYGPFGERLVKKAGTTEMHFVYDGPNLFAEFDSVGKVVREYFYADGKLIGMFEFSDKDGDMMDDGWEKAAFGDLSRGANTDSDGDGITDSQEYQAGTNPLSTTDTDGDGMPDDWERHHFGTLGRDGTGDFDGDGISDREEYQRKLDPKVNDIAWLIPIINYILN